MRRRSMARRVRPRRQRVPLGESARCGAERSFRPKASASASRLSHTPRHRAAGFARRSLAKARRRRRVRRRASRTRRRTRWSPRRSAARAPDRTRGGRRSARAHAPRGRRRARLQRLAWFLPKMEGVLTGLARDVGDGRRARRRPRTTGASAETSDDDFGSSRRDADADASAPPRSGHAACSYLALNAAVPGRLASTRTRGDRSARVAADGARRKEA